MKKFILILLILHSQFSILNCSAQTYQISFAGKGASSTVDSVQVENLTQCKSLSLNGTDTLYLNGTVGINEISNSSNNKLRIYPNPMTGYCLIDFDVTAQGETTFSLYDIAGKRIMQVQEFLIKGQYTYSLSGISSGIYVVKVESAQYSYTAKIVSVNLTSEIAEIKNISAVQASSFQPLASGAIKSLKGNKLSKNMQYTTGDMLKLTGISGIYSTVIMLVPTKNQTDTFNFVACTDGDNNNYTVVKIGTQIWMEENLKTTKYNNGNAIPNVTVDSTWQALSTPAYCWYNDSVKYKSIYGALYNWYTVNISKLCPSGWHVPDTTEWITLSDYLGGNIVAGGKMKEAGTIHWNSPNTGATNESGFTDLPGGSRYDIGGLFHDLGDGNCFWTASEYDVSSAWARGFAYNTSDLSIGHNFSKAPGFSIRCLKN